MNPSGTHPRPGVHRRESSRRVWVCWAVLAACAAVWARSVVRTDMLGYSWIRLHPDDRRAQPGPGDQNPLWAAEVRAVTAMSRSGRVSVTWTHYQSLGPERAGLERQWAGQAGWTHEATPTRSTFTWQPWFEWKPWESVTVLGLGTGGGERQGVWARGVLLPLWLPMAAAAGVLGHRRLTRGARWAREGRCRGCGYSRAGLEAGRKCPECGKGE